MDRKNIQGYVTVAVACQLLSVSHATIRRFIRSNKIDGYNIKRESESKSSPILIRKEFLLSHPDFNKLSDAKKRSLVNDKSVNNQEMKELLNKIDYLIKQFEKRDEQILNLIEENKALRIDSSKLLLTTQYSDTQEERRGVIIQGNEATEEKGNKWWKFW